MLCCYVVLCCVVLSCVVLCCVELCCIGGKKNTIPFTVHCTVECKLSELQLSEHFS